MQTFNEIAEKIILDALKECLPEGEKIEDYHVQIQIFKAAPDEEPVESKLILPN